MKKKKPAVVVLSGGQDSVTCLGLALAEHSEVYAICFRYGQKHVVELECAQRVCDKHHVPLKVVELDFIGKLVTSALTSNGDVGAEHAYKPGLPASFVPNRNAIFLTASHAYAQEVGASYLYTGVCQTDYSGYPDCRLNFIKAMELTLNIGYETDIEILTPLMNLDKAETFALANDNNFLIEVLDDSHTCYNGSRNSNAWGYGCGKCPACELRAKGWEKFQKSL